MGGPGRQFGIEGAHADEPTGLGNSGHGHELVLTVPDIAERSLPLGQGLPDEVLLGQVHQQQLLVRGVGDDAAGGVQNEAVAALAELDGIDGLGREVVPLGAQGHAAEQLAVRAMHGLGDDINDDVAGGGLHDARGDGQVLPAEDRPGIFPVEAVTAGHVLVLGVDAGHDLARGVEKEGGPHVREPGEKGLEELLGLVRRAGKGCLNGVLVGQGLGHLDVVMYGVRGGLGHEARRLVQGVLLNLGDHVIGRGGDVGDERRNTDQDGYGDGNSGNGVDTGLSHRDVLLVDRERDVSLGKHDGFVPVVWRIGKNSAHRGQANGRDDFPT